MPMYGAGFTGPKFEIKEKPMTVKEQLRLSAAYGRIDAALAELEKVATDDAEIARLVKLSTRHLMQARSAIQDKDDAIKQPRVR